MICAGVRNSLVAALIKIDDEEQYRLMAPFFELLIDTTPYSYQPQLGWALAGDGSLGPTSWKLSKLAFQQRFILSEQMTLQSQLNSNNVLIQTLNKQFELATYIDLHRTDVQQGLGAMVQSGLITLARMNEILSTPPIDKETYKGNE